MSVLSVIESMQAFPTQFEAGESVRLMGKPRDFPKFLCSTFMLKHCRREGRPRELFTTRPFDGAKHGYYRTEYAIAATMYVVYLYDHVSGAVVALASFGINAPATKFANGAGAREAARQHFERLERESWRARFGD